MRVRSILAAVALLGFVHLPGLEAKSLSWDSMHVEAHLDRDGALSVTETQAFVFDGDWNGGERRFDVRHGQSLELAGVDRIDGTSEVPLLRGDLSQVDHFELMEGNVLRWRSRLPSDPEFSSTRLTYRIRYVLRGVLRGRGDEYRLNHDFSFGEREGVIRSFTLKLTTDQAWGGIEPVITESAENLEPGRGYVVKRNLRWRGAGRPGGVTTLGDPRVGWGVALLLLAGLAALTLRFVRRERERGRFGGLTPPEHIDQAWLEQHVFSLSPEAVGAAYDGSVGASEVAAAIAALAQEKKIETSVEQKRLRGAALKMRLLVDREAITGYRRTLVNKLFFGGRSETDTEAVRKHYRSTGLDLAKILEDPVEQELKRIPRWKEKEKVVDWKVTIGVLVAATAAAAVVAFRGGNEAALVSTALFYGAIALVGSTIAARLNSRALTSMGIRFPLVFAFTLPLVGAMASYMMRASEFIFSGTAMLVSAAFTLALVNLVFDALRTDEPSSKIEFRKRLISARNFFLAQLAQREPRLLDDWFPYLLAFGLGNNVESWFKAYGGAGSGSVRHTGSIGSSSSSGAGSGGWSGGGGAFGGAGATGSWAVAAASLGAGVAAPSSSSGSSGGGGGGSSSSGGGGGGGW